MSTTKNIAKLAIGDIVYYYGCEFEVVGLPYEATSHRPMSGHLTIAQGPANCVRVDSVCISGEVNGYIKTGTPWTFQGTMAGNYAVNYAVK